MDYELAKQLKDAGFKLLEPVEKKIILFDFPDSTQYCEPTLSGLIEACGNDFDFLQREEGYEWYAHGKKQDIEYGSDKEYAKTPEEAVAKLWLELNKK